MRMLFKISLPVEKANAALKDGSFGATVHSILEGMEPEAAYFAEDNGMRTAFIFVDVATESDIPRLAEPWFQAFNAHLELHPAMIAADLENAGPGIEDAARKYA
ncbi:MAG: hypothetical protein BZY87_07315 [SAR202 cluster bacterium Io17-Chloro-G6]|nr:MAG: hypothetical protein BZY87_07315 [SAR202 cluster bacterium Io17-Chloro-G6]